MEAASCQGSISPKVAAQMHTRIGAHAARATGAMIHAKRSRSANQWACTQREWALRDSYAFGDWPASADGRQGLSLAPVLLPVMLQKPMGGQLMAAERALVHHRDPVIQRGYVAADGRGMHPQLRGYRDLLDAEQHPVGYLAPSVHGHELPMGIVAPAPPGSSVGLVIGYAGPPIRAHLFHHPFVLAYGGMCWTAKRNLWDNGLLCLSLLPSPTTGRRGTAVPQPSDDGAHRKPRWSAA